jgi:hypothetical protein
VGRFRHHRALVVAFDFVVEDDDAGVVLAVLLAMATPFALLVLVAILA